MIVELLAGGGPYRVDVTSDSGARWTTSVHVDAAVVTAQPRRAPRHGKYHVSYEVTPPDGAAVLAALRLARR